VIDGALGELGQAAAVDHVLTVGSDP
jgi:hypothetical protein